MNDREMLELAARAAGPELVSLARSAAGFPVFYRRIDAMELWNPRDDDGDSRRLEVALGLHVSPGETEVDAWVEGAHGGQYSATERWDSHNGDRCAATRLAVLRCAAEIGKAMLTAPAADHTAPQSPPPA